MAAVGDVVSGIISIAGAATTTVIPASGETWHITEIGSSRWDSGQWGNPELMVEQYGRSTGYTGCWVRDNAVYFYRSNPGAYVEYNTYLKLWDQSGAVNRVLYTGMRVE